MRKVPKQELGNQQTLNPKIQALLDEINDPATEPTRRLAIGDELEQLGDPRRGVGLDANGLPDIDWVEIPGGPFIYQNGETRELPTYWISRYPVTNRKFQAFIAAGGYQKPTAKRGKAKAILDKLTGQKTQAESVLANLWQDLQQPKPAKSTWSQANRPRTDVEWMPDGPGKLPLPRPSVRLWRRVVLIFCRGIIPIGRSCPTGADKVG